MASASTSASAAPPRTPASRTGPSAQPPPSHRRTPTSSATKAEVPPIGLDSLREYEFVMERLREGAKEAAREIREEKKAEGELDEDESVWEEVERLVIEQFVNPLHDTISKNITINGMFWEEFEDAKKEKEQDDIEPRDPTLHSRVQQYQEKLFSTRLKNSIQRADLPSKMESDLKEVVQKSSNSSDRSGGVNGGAEEWARAKVKERERMMKKRKNGKDKNKNKNADGELDEDLNEAPVMATSEQQDHEERKTIAGVSKGRVEEMEREWREGGKVIDDLSRHLTGQVTRADEALSLSKDLERLGGTDVI